jgi:hypothetical protein
MARAVTLLRIGLAFVAVAALFVGFAWITGGGKRGTALAPAVEALAVTLLAALWFGSLGHGGWVLVFLLVGILASGLGARTERGGVYPVVRVTVITTIRYIAAGALLALIIG